MQAPLGVCTGGGGESFFGVDRKFGRAPKSAPCIADQWGPFKRERESGSKKKLRSR